MYKATIYKLLRCLVCLLLVCCILINCSPIRAKATAIAATAVTGTAAAGVLGWLFAAAMGVVFVDLTEDLLSGIGTSVKQHVSTYYEDDTETTTTVNDFWSDLSYTFGGSGDDGTSSGNGSDDSDSGLTHIPTLMLAGLIDWAKGLINGEGIEVENVDVSDSEPPITSFSFSHYTSTYTVTTDGPCVLGVCEATNGDSENRYFVICSGPSQINYKSGGIKSFQTYLDSETGYYFALVTSTSGSNVFSLNYSVDSPYVFADLGEASSYVAFFPILADYYNGQKDIVIEPSIYVGDIPQQVQDGTFEEEKYELPYINYSQIFQGQTDVIEALNNVSAQLADQTMTYQQYMEAIQAETSTDTSGGSSDIETPSPVPDLAPYVFDLKKYFPFCIPFDLYDFFSILVAEPEAPQFHWEIQDLSGNVYEIDLDLSPWDDLASFFRILQLFLFITGLAASSRKFIKW